MWFRGDVPQELAEKRKLLVSLYFVFFVSSTLAFPLLYVNKEDFLMSMALGIGESLSESILGFLLILFIHIRCYSLPIIIAYSIIEICIIFLCKKINTCTTYLFRSFIAFHDFIFLILNIFLTVKYGGADFILIVWILSYLCSLVTNCFLLFIVSGFKQKGHCFSCNHFE